MKANPGLPSYDRVAQDDEADSSGAPEEFALGRYGFLMLFASLALFCIGVEALDRSFQALIFAIFVAPIGSTIIMVMGLLITICSKVPRSEKGNWVAIIILSWITASVAPYLALSLMSLRGC